MARLQLLAPWVFYREINAMFKDEFIRIGVIIS